MLNQVILVGRITRDPEVKTTENDKKVSNITIAIPRSYKNMNGEYDTDFIDITLWNAIAESTSEYCKKGDIVGVKGSLQTNSYEKNDGSKEFRLNVVAEKVTFLSKAKENHEYEER